MAGTEKEEEEEYKREDQRERNIKSREGESPGEWYTFRVFFFFPRPREMVRGHFFLRSASGGKCWIAAAVESKMSVYIHLSGI